MRSEAMEEGSVEEETGAETEVVVSAAVIATSEAFEVVETVKCPEKVSGFIDNLQFITSLIYHNDLLIIFSFRFQKLSWWRQ